MNGELRVTCTKGLTGLKLEDEIVMVDGVLQQPSSWPTWERLGPTSGRVELTGGWVRFNHSFEGPSSNHLLMTMSVDPDDPRPEAKHRCFRALPGTGEKVVGTWIAEGGG